MVIQYFNMNKQFHDIFKCRSLFNNYMNLFSSTGYYLKFFHNVMMNSFATIYFHNYLRLDEMPVPASNQIRIAQGLKSPDTNSDTEINVDESNGTPSIHKENLESKTNTMKNEVMNTIVTIKIDGKENSKGKWHLE